ncbi:MAG: rod shape-determining protein MreC [Chlamydiales bacterium]|nr:rod shape-determining protein MreC [Chlamydiia bacterium]MCP5507382.1 rod shape-determining protein MreC [Chlamydiales bacterium]
MRRAKLNTSNVILAVLLLLLFSIPSQPAERLRGTTAAMLAPAWQQALDLKLLLNMPLFPEKENTASQEELERLQLENQSLLTEVSRLRELFHHELFLITQLHNNNDTSLLQQHQSDLKNMLAMQMETIPARIIFRSPSSWSSSLWVNVGNADNALLERPMVQINSPVVVGSSVVGVIDYVGTNQSRVRLITDSGLTPSVRAIRGDMQNSHLNDMVSMLLGTLATRSDLFTNADEKKKILDTLQLLRKKTNGETWYLAKGEIQGSSAPLWRSRGNMLRGIGFNYDFADNEGPARDLRTGKPINAAPDFPTMAIIQAGDHLITTGLDGVFPAGLHVAQVSYVAPLREGDYYYELNAKPTAGNFDELSLVYIMPPVGYDPGEKAHCFRR